MADVLAAASRLSCRIRAMRVREARVLADRKPSKSGRPYRRAPRLRDGRCPRAASSTAARCPGDPFFGGLTVRAKLRARVCLRRGLPERRVPTRIDW